MGNAPGTELAKIDAGIQLTTKEATLLKGLENVIENALKTADKSVAQMASAFEQIRDGKLYRDVHGTFEAYLLNRWGIHKTWAYEIMAQATIKGVLSVRTDKLPDPTARHMRELAPFKDKPEELIGAWQRSQEEHGKPTPAQTREVVQARLAELEPRAEPPLEPVDPDDVEPVDPEPPIAAQALATRIKTDPARTAKTFDAVKRAGRAALADGWFFDELCDALNELDNERDA